MFNKKIAVRLKNVSKYYDEGDYILKLYENLNVDFKSGDISLILGRSGSGKSTLLNIITGVDVANSGQVYVDNMNLSDFSEDGRTLFRRKNIGVVFQFFHLINTLSVIDNIMLPLELNGYKDSECMDIAYQLLDIMGLTQKAKIYPDTLSGGEQQKVAIARAIAHKPRILVADEPTGNLDSSNRQMILDILFKLVKDSGQTLIMATHSQDLIDKSDSAYIVHNLGLKKLK
jgi:putative ABC transport system ATP-binding protein